MPRAFSVGRASKQCRAVQPSQRHMSMAATTDQQTPSARAPVQEVGFTRGRDAVCTLQSTRPRAPHGTGAQWPSQTASLQILRSALAATCMSAALLLPCPDALAARNRLPPPGTEAGRCSMEALDKFADTRAAFSQEASSGMEEAYVDVRNCDYSGKDLREKVFSGVLQHQKQPHRLALPNPRCTITAYLVPFATRSAVTKRVRRQASKCVMGRAGVLMRGANFSGSKFVGVEFARVDAKGADLSNADFTDVNGYSSIFDGANLQDAQFENAILTGA